jgi:3-oxoacyl-[acyl-carrier protein] reductase
MTEDNRKNRVVLVTGASRGIGRAVALQFARTRADLVLNFARNATAMGEVQEACLAAGSRVVVQQGSIADPETAQRLCDTAVEKFGGLDVLVNNAGIVVDNPLEALSDDEVRIMVCTNAQGPVWMARAALRPMMRQRSGCIINVSSVLATRPGRGNAVYAATKGFVESFTRALAVEVGCKGIRVNAVAPGMIETDMSKELRAGAGEALAERIALRRFGNPDEIASVIVFLASDQATYTHGAIVPVDGAFCGGM